MKKGLAATSRIGFNAAVGDDDNGGLSYVRSEFAAHTDSFTAWDGRSVGWYVFAERDWGNLYMAPPNSLIESVGGRMLQRLA